MTDVGLTLVFLFVIYLFFRVRELHHRVLALESRNHPASLKEER